MEHFIGVSRGVKRTVFLGVLVLIWPKMKEAMFPIYRRPFDGRDSDKVVIITGATGNLGVALSRQLAQRKFRVIMACRDMEKCKAIRREIVIYAKSHNVVCRQLDLEDIDSINNFVKNIKETEPRLDILINNAGVKNVETKQMTKYNIEKNYFVNYLGPYLLTLLLLDKMKETAAVLREARIINVVGTFKKDTKIHLDDINFDRRKYKPELAYQQSKLALAYFTILLEKLNKEQKVPIYTYATSPGNGRIQDSMHLPTTLYDKIGLMWEPWVYWNAERAIQPVLRCVMDPQFGSREYSGKLYSYICKHWGWRGADKDEVQAKRVWNSAADLLLAPK